ncbi:MULTISPECIES: signal peptidase II [unclassified Thioalkalivibrio]|uniref:signal peptidase II n=1 Tax=unclassified Thioalkalivibrio TaxID=2621013 RepID=UPI00036CD494|nr:MULTISPECIES: signal peptidase II [unclassified Thioalkalivibrio]
MRLAQSGLRPGLLIAVAVALLDQVTKWWAENALTLYAPVEVTSFFNLSLVYNPGAAFSFLAGAGDWGRWFLSGVAVVIGLLILWWLARLPRQARWSVTALGLVLGGAVGNLIDRIAHGRVIDFLDFHWAGYHWPAFNVADMAIVVGAITLIVATFIEGDHSGSPTDSRE